MSDENLFDGVGMVIDDHVFDDSGNGDRIVKLVDYLENNRKIPLVKYDSLPEFSDMNVLSSIKFLLLDWDLVGITSEDGFGLGNIGQIKESSTKASIRFLHEITESIVIPIFIFSNDSIDNIKVILKEERLWTDGQDGGSHIFIKSKSDLFGEEERCVMFDVINEWLRSTPSMYVIQKWNMSYSQAINSMALDMMTASVFWPNVLWKCYTIDGINPSEEITSVINQNVLSRIQPVEFDKQILGEERECTNDVLKNVLGKHCFIEKDKLEESTSVGDIFKKDGKLYLNIRPACDCVGRDNNEVEIYLLRGDKIKDGKIKDKYSDKYGNFNEQTNTAIVGPVNGVFVEFRFNDLQIVPYEDWKDRRIGRVIPPYITHIVQKYGLYIHRQGLPRIPKEVILDKQEIVEQEDAVQQQIENLRKQLADSNKRNKTLTEKIEKLEKFKNVKPQSAYMLYNCKVNIVPNPKRRKFKK